MYYTVNYKCKINKYKKGWYKMGVIIDGKKISEEVLCEVKAETEKMKNEGLVPCLAVVLVGDDAASKIYVNNKKKACEKVGIKSEEYLLDKSTSEKELISLINELNNKKSVSGILVQLPLPEHINEDAVINAISSEKDVDSFNSVNVSPAFKFASPVANLPILISGPFVSSSIATGAPVFSLACLNNSILPDCSS